MQYRGVARAGTEVLPSEEFTWPVFRINLVCINQKDLAKRGVQVAKMGDIFRNATQVDVWLGQEAHNSNVAIDLVNLIANSVSNELS